MYVVVHCKISGTVKSVTMELTAVSDTDSATSPLASMEKTLLDEPPGQHAMSMMPIKNIGGSWNIDTRHPAIAGSRMS